MNENIELIIRSLCDTQPKSQAHGAYLFCQTINNQISSFHAAVDLINNHLAAKILILDEKEKSGYPGATKWLLQLEKLGLGSEQIEMIAKHDSSNLNTLTESEALIRHAGNKGYRSLFVVAPPFQQVRAFMTAITVAIKVYPGISIYSYPGEALPWHEKVIHSQGILEAKRCELIHAELERINTYQKKGDLALFEQVLDYRSYIKIAFFFKPKKSSGLFTSRCWKNCV